MNFLAKCHPRPGGPPNFLLLSTDDVVELAFFGVAFVFTTTFLATLTLGVLGVLDFGTLPIDSGLPDSRATQLEHRTAFALRSARGSGLLQKKHNITFLAINSPVWVMLNYTTFKGICQPPVSAYISTTYGVYLGFIWVSKYK